MVKSQNERKIMEAFVSPQGQIIKEFLQECLEDKRDSVMTFTEIELVYRAQGAGQELKEIITLANNAKKVLNS